MKTRSDLMTQYGIVEGDSLKKYYLPLSSIKNPFHVIKIYGIRKIMQDPYDRWIEDANIPGILVGLGISLSSLAKTLWLFLRLSFSIFQWVIFPVGLFLRILYAKHLMRTASIKEKGSVPPGEYRIL